MLPTWEIAHRWNTMCEMFIRNADTFRLEVDPLDELKTFRRIYENGYVRTLVQQWLADIPAPAPTDAECHQNVHPDIVEEQPAYEQKTPQTDITNLTAELDSKTPAGRYVVIAPGTKIEAGDPVISERAFAMVPVQMPPAAGNDIGALPPRCSGCADLQTLDELRCKQCARFGFCSVACRQRDGEGPATDGLHRFECPGYRMGLFAALGVSHLAMRTFLYGAGQLDAVHSSAALSGSGGDALPEWWLDLMRAADKRAADVDYARVLRLMTNYAKTGVEDVLRYALTAAMFTIYLKECTDFFTSASSGYAKFGTANVAELVAGALIFRHLGQTVNNAHTILGLVVQAPPNPEGVEPNPNAAVVPDAIPLGGLHEHVSHEVIATALYPRVAMLNHSCRPNIRNRFDGARLTICATRPLSGGSELLNSYCPVQLDGAERRRGLREQYGFECECERCSEEETAAASSPSSPRATLAGNDDDADAYSCPCGTRINADAVPTRWWQDPELSNDIVIKCPQCDGRLTFNWFVPYMACFEREEKVIAPQQRKWLMEDTCRLYAEAMAGGVLPEGHSLRAFMATMFLGRYPLAELKPICSDAEICSMLVTIARDYAIGHKQKYGQLSNEHIEACNIWLDLLALRKHLFGSPAADIGEIRTVIKCLASVQVRQLYEKYFESHIL